MPLIDSSHYKRPLFLFNEHLETIVPSAFRKVQLPLYQRERIKTRDGDFLDLDWIRNGNKKLVYIFHGLEGNSFRPYVKGMAKVFAQNDYDVMAWNCRSCSGVMNDSYHLYHHGATKDVEDAFEQLQTLNYEHIFLVGFSMGGAQIVKFLGENASKVSISGAVVFSVPFNLQASAEELSKIGNGFYRKRFMRKLKKKIHTKIEQFPDVYPDTDLDQIQHFHQLDERITAPVNGFKTARDFYDYASPGNYLDQVKVPLLIVNALNDPMLPESCYPYTIAVQKGNIWLETPQHGGHVGFSTYSNDPNWAELRAFEFIRSLA